MKKENDYKKIFKIIFMVYFALSPIFDTVFLYSHMTTLFRVIILIIFAIFTVLLYKESRKSALYLLAYYLAMGLFLMVNYFHAGSFKSLVPGNFNYSLISEASTILKLCMPFTIFFVVKYQRLTKEDYFHIINVWILLSAGSIVICNLFGYSMGSYSDTIVRNSIFTWGQNLPVELTATKGFFVYANQVTVLLLVSLIFAIYEFLFINKKKIFYIILIAFASLMLGTRLSTYGGLLVLFAIGIGYILYFILFKKKICKRAILLIPIAVLWIAIIPYSPNQNRVAVMESVEDRVIEDNNNYTQSIVDERNETVKILDATHLLNRQFYTEFYPYEYDPEFWDEISREHINDISNYRFIEIAIIQRIWKIDDRWSNKLLGISNTRIQNVVNIERDIVLQYYAFGIIGSILILSPYIYIIGFCLVLIFKHWRAIDIAILACAILFLMCSFFSGNTINFLAIIVPVSFMIGHMGLLKD